MRRYQLSTPGVSRTRWLKGRVTHLLPTAPMNNAIVLGARPGNIFLFCGHVRKDIQWGGGEGGVYSSVCVRVLGCGLCTQHSTAILAF